MYQIIYKKQANALTIYWTEWHKTTLKRANLAISEFLLQKVRGLIHNGILSPASDFYNFNNGFVLIMS
jgi:hypothetical protein